MKRVLVTGSAGFIGYHLVSKLIKENFEVYGLDNLNDYYDINLKFSRLSQNGIKKEKLKKNKLIQSDKYNNYFFVKADLCDNDFLVNLFKNKKFKYVINLAAQAGVRYSIKNPSSYIQSNILGFYNLLECCKNNKVNHLIYASSSSVYGESNTTPFRISDFVDKPISLYAATKKSNELMAHSYGHLFGLKTTGLRFFTVYGPWGRPDMALFKFTKNILRKKKITVFNKGNHKRDFTYIDDAVNLTLLASDRISHFSKKKTPFKIFNIGSNSPIKLNKFISIIEKILKIKARKKMFNLQKGDMISTYSNSSKIFKKFNYFIKSNHYNNIAKFIYWYRDYCSK